MIGKPRGGGFGDGAAQFERAEAALREVEDVKREADRKVKEVEKENEELRIKLKTSSKTRWSNTAREGVGKTLGSIFVLVGLATGANYLLHTENNTTETVGQGAEPAEETVEERLEFSNNGTSTTFTTFGYYYGDEDLAWLTLYQPDSGWSDDLNQLTLWRRSHESQVSTLVTFFDAKRNPTRVVFLGQENDCDEQRNQRLCSWAKHRLDYWISRINNLTPNQTVEQMMRDGVMAPCNPHPIDYPNNIEAKNRP